MQRPFLLPEKKSIIRSTAGSVVPKVGWNKKKKKERSRAAVGVSHHDSPFVQPVI
jgi:hypothetical protein